MSRFTNPVPQFYLNNGDIASSGKLYFYETGTATEKTTYSDYAQTIPNTNPVILSGEGRCPNIFGNGRYTVVFESSNATGSVQQWTRDDVELSVELGQYADWSAILTYRVNDIVRGSDGEYYRSIVNTNTGNDPTTDETKWEQLAFLTYWNENVTYKEDQNIIFSGLLYRSTINDNLNNTPSIDSAEWEQISITQVSATVELGGDFDIGAKAVFERVGNFVTVTLIDAGHTTGSAATSENDVVPPEFRVSLPALTFTGIGRILNSSVNYVTMNSTSNGIEVQHRQWDGTAYTIGTSGTGYTLTYPIAQNIT